MDNKDLSIVAALAKSVGGGGGSSTPIPTPTAQDVGKVIKVDDNGAYGLGTLWKDVTGTLTAGQTSVVISDSSITSSSTIQVFTDTGINYTAISVSTGSVTITYPAQQADVNVKVRVS